MRNETGDRLKKVLILTNNASGLYSFRFELIERLIQMNFDVYFAVPQTMDDKKIGLITDSGAKYLYSPMNRRGMNPFEDLKLIKCYKKLIKDINPDVILTYTIKSNIYGNYVANKWGIPVIMNITGIGTSLASGKFKWIIRKLYKYACRKSRYVFFQNEGNHNYFITNNLVNADKTRIIPGSGVNIEKFVQADKTKDYGITKFLFIGRMMKDKGIDEYLEAAQNITNKYDNVEFQILGSAEEKKYKSIIDNISNGRIRYLGKSDDVRNEIREVDCIVNPSYHEGMSNVLLEGAAMGKPLIASNIPGCKEIIDDDINGFLAQAKSSKDLEDKLIQFIELEEEARIAMGNNSRKKVEKEFDRNIVIDNYIQAISSILGGSVLDESL